MLAIAMSDFEQACRPVIFEHTHPDIPYWGKGSSFLIASARAHYWVTASHVLSNLGGTAQSLRIFPSDYSRISLPFNEQYTITRGLAADEEHKDVVVLRVDLDEFGTSGDAPLVAQDIEQGVLIAERLALGTELMVIGYPSESNFVDYDVQKIKNTRSVLRAVYQGPSISDHCHKLKFETSVQLESFDGLSGSPIFHLLRKVSNGQELLFPMLVGMLLRGSASSANAHFVSANIIVNLITQGESNA
jgi:hypothetical protein